MDLWARILTTIETKVDPQTYDTWFRPTSQLAATDQGLDVSVPNEVFRDWLTQKYAGLIEGALSEVDAQPARVRFMVSSAADAPAPAGERSSPAAPERARETLAAEASTPAPYSSASTALNPKYTFDSFVVGASNQFANAAARAVAERPSRSYNPLFIYGGVGLGKTHLMLAIGHHIRKQSPLLSIVYLSSERFMNELINSIRYDRTHEFRERYRTIDILLMDDIQFLAGKERTQEEFFHTFNALHQEQRQIVVTSDSPPKAIPTLEERLQSRFEWGLLADIQPPDLETKVAILKKKAALESSSQTLPDDVLHYIANGSKSNIRELEGALIRLLAYASLTGEPISLEMSRRVLRDTLKTSDTVVTIDRIQQRVAEFYGLRTSDLSSRSNERRITRPRQIAMFLCKALTHHSLPEIGRAFGGKHHSTVIHSVRKVTLEISKSEELSREVNSLKESLQ